MDWPNEEYVKVYRRETDDDLVLSWQARALWKEMLVKFDRSGLIETRRGARGLAAMVRWPLDVVEVALPELVEDGRVRPVATGFFAPNFLEAQEASKSDRARQRESRQRRASTANRAVTPQICHDDTPSRDQTSRGPEAPDETSQVVTLSSADPNPLLSEPRAREIPPTAVPSTGYDAENPRQRGALAESTFARVSEARLDLAREFGLPEQLPFPTVTPGSQPQAFRDLCDRVREEGSSAPLVCNVVVESLIAEARRTRSVEWVSLKAFSSGAWNTARERVPGWKKSRAGPASLRISSPSDDPDLSNDPFAPRP